MKYSIGIITTVILFAALILSGCDRPSNNMENAETSVIEADRDSEIATSEVEEELRIYRAENAERFKEFNRTTSEIKQQIRNESDEEVRDRLKTMLDEHEATHRELKREIDNHKVSERDNWDDFKDSFSNRMDDFGDSLNNFFSTTTTSSTN
jgi:hypothetical protein